MNRRIAQIALVVEDYDQAITFYVDTLGFRLLEDKIISPEKRWVVVKPEADNGAALLLAKASNDIQKQSIGNQSGGRVFLFLETNNFDRDYQKLLQKNVTIVRQPIVESYGKVAVFSDLYGNLWDLIEPASQKQS